MEAIRIEILNPKAMKLLKGMQDLNLIKVNKEPESNLKAYLKKMRNHASEAPDVEEIAKIVEAVRQKRNEKK